MRARGWRRIGIGALLVGCLSGVAGCGGGDTDPPSAPAAPPGDPALVVGRRIYVSYCAECHGLDGAGRRSGPVAPSLHDVARRMTFEQQVTLVRTGRGLMPSQATVLTDAELAAVVSYERTVF